MNEWLEISGAYGRDYKSAKAANADWLAGLDFRDNTTGQYLSIRDMGPELNVIIRYNGGLKVTNAKRLPKGAELPVANVDYVDASEMEITRAGGGELPASTIEVVESTGVSYSEPIKLSGKFTDSIGAEITTDEITALLEPMGDFTPFEHPEVTHDCKTPSFLLTHFNDSVELAGEDAKLYSYEEFEEAVIQDANELFGDPNYMDCKECESMRCVWITHQFVRAMEGIHIIKRGAAMDMRKQLENLRLAIKYELEIARDMDGK